MTMLLFNHARPILILATEQWVLGKPFVLTNHLVTSVLWLAAGTNSKMSVEAVAYQTWIHGKWKVKQSRLPCCPFWVVYVRQPSQRAWIFLESPRSQVCRFLLSPTSQYYLLLTLSFCLIRHGARPVPQHGAARSHPSPAGKFQVHAGRRSCLSCTTAWASSSPASAIQRVLAQRRLRSAIHLSWHSSRSVFLQPQDPTFPRHLPTTTRTCCRARGSRKCIFQSTEALRSE